MLLALVPTSFFFFFNTIDKEQLWFLAQKVQLDSDAPDRGCLSEMILSFPPVKIEILHASSKFCDTYFSIPLSKFFTWNRKHRLKRGKSALALKPNETFILLQAALWSILDWHGGSLIFCSDPSLRGFYVFLTGQLGIAHPLSDARAGLAVGRASPAIFLTTVAPGYGLILN